MNLRPPGPQPGALPDCATPRGCCRRKRATGIEPALEAWKASVQPQHFARSRRSDRSRALGRRSGAAGAPRSAPRRLVGERRRRPGAEPVVAAPSSVTTRPAERAAERRGEQRDEPGVLLLAAEALERHRLARAPRQTCSGYLRSDSVSKWPAAAATTAMPSAAHSPRQLARSALDGGAGGARVGHPGEAVVRGERDVDDRARRRPGASRARPRRAPSLSVPPTLSRVTGPPALGLDRLGGHEVLAAGVVDEHVEAAVALEGARRRSARRPRGSRMSPATPSAPADLARRRLEHLRRGGRRWTPWRRRPQARGRPPCRGPCRHR